MQYAMLNIVLMSKHIFNIAYSLLPKKEKKKKRKNIANSLDVFQTEYNAIYHRDSGCLQRDEIIDSLYMVVATLHHSPFLFVFIIIIIIT